MSEQSNYRDDVTGAEVRMLTTAPARDWVVYQTHPMWTPGMSHLMFYSDRSGAGKTSLWAIEMRTGDIRPIVEDVGPAVLARKDDRLYHIQGRDILCTRLVGAFEGHAQTERVSMLPSFAPGAHADLTIDANEETLYTGMVVEPGKRWAILSLHMPSGAWRKVVEVDFKSRHREEEATSGSLRRSNPENPYRPQMMQMDADGEKEHQPQRTQRNSEEREKIFDGINRINNMNRTGRERATTNDTNHTNGRRDSFAPPYSCDLWFFFSLLPLCASVPSVVSVPFHPCPSTPSADQKKGLRDCFVGLKPFSQ